MKISALPQGSGGTPGQALQGATGRTASPEKLAVAKAIAAGDKTIRVLQAETPIDPQVKRAQESIRRIKMRTNASPERFTEVLEAQSQVAPQATEQTQSAISDTTEQVNATVEATQPLSPQFAALAKQRRALQVKEREIADREKALTAQPANDGSTDVIARLKSDPLSVLQEHGVTYDQLTQAIIANQSGASPELQALKAEIKALKEGVDKNFTERDSAAEQQVLAEMRREAEQLAKEGDAFEMVRETQSLEDVMTLIHRTYKETGEVLDVSEAMQLVEDELINESLKIANIKKVQGRLTAPPASQPSQQQQRTMKTLTNRDTATVPMDRKARALAAALGTLRK